MATGLVPSDTAVSNARVSQLITAGTARFGTLNGDVLDVDQVIANNIDTTLCQTNTVNALTTTVTTLHATDVQTDTETVGTLTATALTTDALNASGTVDATTVNAVDLTVTGTLIASAFSTAFVGMLKNTGDGNAFDFYVAPNVLLFADGSGQPSTQPQATFFLPTSITITSFSGTSVGAVFMTFNLVYGSTQATVTTPVFAPSTVNNDSFAHTGSVTLPANSFLSVQFTGLGNANLTYNSWSIGYH